MNLPPHLYKYRAVNDFLQGILVDHSIWLPQVTDFNDPFDCAPAIYSKGPMRNLMRALSNSYKRKNPGRNRHERRGDTKAIWKSHPVAVEKKLGTPAGDAAMKEAFDKAIRNGGIYCVSASNDVVLMWSHYADSHKGICLRFKTDDKPFSTAIPVRYDKQRPRINPLVDKNEGFALATLTKADYWAYEDEWRILVHKHHGPMPFERQSLDGIILGAKTTLEDEQRVRDWAAQGGLKVEWQRASFDAATFRLNIIPA